MRRRSGRHQRPPRWFTLVLTLVAAATASSACSSGPAAGSSSTTTPTAVGGLLTIRTGKVHGAVVLENARGYTLYWYTRDKPGHLACTGACTKLWRPFLLPKGDKLPSTQGLGIELRSGNRQVTYKNSPLYTYAGDKKPGGSRGLRVPNWRLATIPTSS